MVLYCRFCGKRIKKKNFSTLFCTAECSKNFKDLIAESETSDFKITRTRKDGYSDILIEGKWLAEHRYVMSQILGRPLISGVENVHHINGVRNDNRPENLELWIRPQLYGVRAKDIKCPSCGVDYFTSQRATF